MSVSGVNNYRDTLYHWQAEQLKNTGSSGSGSSSSSSNILSSLFGGTTSMTSQISSMVELTKYAMDKMGVGSDSRVTFNQITKYREKLLSEFNASVKEGFKNSGITDISSLSFSLDKDGKISATGGNADDRKKAQSWLDANPYFGKDIQEALKKANIENAAFDFRISTSGKMTLIDNVTKNLQAALDEKSSLTESLRKGLAEKGIDLDGSLEFAFDAAGELSVKNGGENEQAINDWLAENPEVGKEIAGILEKKNIEPSSVTLRLGQTGNIQANVNNAANNDIQAVLDQHTDTGARIMTGLNSLAIDPNVTFSIQMNDDGTISIISDHPDKDKVQRFFDENPELLKKYSQIETLAGIDDARKAMQISPSAMRKRIQIESMSAWWASSGNSNSYFGNYDNGNMSLLAGLNLTI